MRKLLQVLCLVIVLGITLSAPGLAAIYECYCNGDFVGYVNNVDECIHLCVD